MFTSTDLASSPIRILWCRGISVSYSFSDGFKMLESAADGGCCAYLSKNCGGNAQTWPIPSLTSAYLCARPLNLCRESVPLCGLLKNLPAYQHPGRHDRFASEPQIPVQDAS